MWAALLIISLYGFCLLGVFRFLRAHFDLASSMALSVPLCQAIISLFFQLRYLTGLHILHPSLAIFFSAGCLIYALKKQTGLALDFKRIYGFLKAQLLLGALLLTTLIYAFAQVIFMPPGNFDALTYHLPRVFLFIQEDTLLLDAFSRYHQAIFPVAADILFLPFVELGTMHGMCIYSLTSYLSLGASAYVLARRHASQHIAAITAFIVLSFPILVLQSVSLKNDLLMSAAGAAAVLLAIRPPRPEKREPCLWIFLLISSYGVGCKSTFIAFLPGLALAFILSWKLYQSKNIVALLSIFRRKWITSTGLFVAVIILSQVWLFAWNIREYGSWSGPDSFTERHQQHDGLQGAAANAVRYGLQIAHAGPWTDMVLSQSIGVDPFSDQLNRFYEKTLEPLLHAKGASRESFEVNWRLFEDWAWFGPLGALTFFVILPFALFRKPSLVVELLPPLVYFCIICAMISWMPWNGRFFTIFFVGLAPAIALFGSCVRAPVFFVLGLAAGCSLLSTKVFDFSRPLIPIDAALYQEGHRSLLPALKYSLAQKNAWSREFLDAPLHKGSPETLLSQVEQGATVGVYVNSHFRHYGFYMARPELSWYPLNHIGGADVADLNKAWTIFIASDLDYLLCLGIYSRDLDEFLVKESPDGGAHLLRHPRHTHGTSLGIDP